MEILPQALAKPVAGQKSGQKADGGVEKRKRHNRQQCRFPVLRRNEHETAKNEDGRQKAGDESGGRENDRKAVRPAFEEQEYRQEKDQRAQGGCDQISEADDDDGAGVLELQCHESERADDHHAMDDKQQAGHSGGDAALGDDARICHGPS